MKLEMFLQVIDGSKGNFTTNGDLYTKTVETGFVPLPGTDEVALWKTIEDGKEWDGPIWHVKRRYMGAEGQWSIELAKMILNPNQMWQDSFKARLASGRQIITETSWYTQFDDDPIPKLLEGGWVKYK